MTATLELAKQFIKLRSITPDDCGCQQLIAERLARLDFEIESLPYEDVSNLWAVHGSEGPLFVFAGHTDVVPTGPAEEWSSDPFTPTETDGFLFGRGAADMKSSLAAMLVATERFRGGEVVGFERVAFYQSGGAASTILGLVGHLFLAREFPAIAIECGSGIFLGCVEQGAAT